MGENLRSVETGPDKIIGYRQVGFARPAEQVRGVPRFCKNLNQSPGVTKRIEIDSSLRFHTEFFAEIVFSDQDLSD